MLRDSLLVFFIVSDDPGRAMPLAQAKKKRSQ